MSDSPSGGPRTTSPRRIEEYWAWIAIALFLLLTVDLLTSIYAAGTVGLEHESNPVMRWLLAQHVAVIVGANVLAAGLVTLFFYGLMELLEYAPERSRRVLAVGIEVWLGLLIAIGLLVFANNVSVIVLGESLL